MLNFVKQFNKLVLQIYIILYNIVYHYIIFYNNFILKIYNLLNMKELTVEEKLNYIIKKAEELNITAYEFGNNTEISTLGASNILNGTSKNPRMKNLNIMLQYIESKIVGAKYNQEIDPNFAREPNDENYKDDDLETIMYKRIYRRFERKFTDIENRLRKLEGKK